MRKNDLLLLVISTFIIVLAWIGFSVYHGFADSTISETLNTQIVPIAPNFDTKAIEDLKGRQVVVPLLEGVTPAISGTPSPSPTSSLPALSPTPSTVLESPEATSSSLL